MIYLENNTQVQDVYIPRQSPITATGQPYYATTEYVDDRFDAETARTEETYAKQEELSAYTPTTGFTTINGSAITEGGNITIEGRIYSAGTNISIDEDNVISVTGLPDTQAVEGMVSSALTAYTDTAGMEQAISAATASTTGWVESQGYLTEHQSLSAYSTTDEVESMVSAATEGMATRNWVNANFVDDTELEDAFDDSESSMRGWMNGRLNNYTPTSGMTAAIDASTAATTAWVETQGYITACTGGAGVEEVTQAEYDALVSGGTVDPDTMYVITDAPTIDIDDLASKRLQELDSTPSNLQDGDIINLEDGAYKYFSGGSRTTAWWSINPSAASASWNFNALVYSYIPSGQALFDYRRTTSGNWRRIKYEGDYIRLYDEGDGYTTPISSITYGQTARFYTSYNSAYYIDCKFEKGWFGFNRSHASTNVNITNVWDGITSGAHLESLFVPDLIPYGVSGGGLPNWDEHGNVVGIYSTLGTKNMYFNATGTSASARLTVLTNGTGNGPDHIFGPADGGTAGQMLVSNGNAAPVWTNWIKSVKITSDAYDALVQAGTTDANTLYLLVD